LPQCLDFVRRTFISEYRLNHTYHRTCELTAAGRPWMATAPRGRMDDVRQLMCGRRLCITDSQQTKAIVMANILMASSLSTYRRCSFVTSELVVSLKSSGPMNPAFQQHLIAFFSKRHAPNPLCAAPLTRPCKREDWEVRAGAARLHGCPTTAPLSKQMDDQGSL
jgi:hypothetical protein